MKLSEEPTLPSFANHCLLPYLYAISRKLKYGGEMVFGELAHGGDGLFDDYSEILGLTEKASIVRSLFLLSLKKRGESSKGRVVVNARATLVLD